MNRVQEVNRALKARGAAERLRAGRGYYYFHNGDAASWPVSSIETCSASSLSLERWMWEYDYLRSRRTT